MKCVKTTSENKDFKALVKLLDAELAERDGEDHAFYNQFNKIDTIKQAIVLYEKDKPIACGALKAFNKHAMEVKRMYTLLNYRGKGIAVEVLEQLEKWALELHYRKCVLETGLKQPEAIKLYEKCGYKQTANYGQYIGVENSRCFEKELKF